MLWVLGPCIACHGHSECSISRANSSCVLPGLARFSVQPFPFSGSWKKIRLWHLSHEVKKDYVRGFKRSSLYAMDWAGA